MLGRRSFIGDDITVLIHAEPTGGKFCLRLTAYADKGTIAGKNTFFAAVYILQAQTSKTAVLLQQRSDTAVPAKLDVGSVLHCLVIDFISTKAAAGGE